MSMRADLDRALNDLHAAFRELRDNLAALEGVIADHFGIPPSSAKVPPKIMQSLEKDIKDITAQK